MNRKHFNIVIEILFLVLLFLAAIIFDRRIGIVFSLTKVTTIRFFSILIMSVWAIKILIFKEHKWVRSILDWPIATYILSCAIATISSVHVYISLFGFYGRFEGLITLFNFVLLFFIATNYITSIKAIKRLLVTVCSASVIMSIYSILQRKGIDPYAWGGVVTWNRVIATIGQPNFYAAYAGMAFFLTFILFLLPKKTNSFEIKSFLPSIYFVSSILIFILMIYNLGTSDVILWYLSFIVCSVFAVLFAYKYEDSPPIVLDGLLGVSLIVMYTGLFYTQSRGGFIGLFAAFSLFFIIGPKEIIFRNWKKLALLFIALIIVTGVTISDPQFSIFKRMTTEIEIENTKNGDSPKIEFQGAAGSRGETWKSGFNIISDHPFFGVGPEVLKMVFPRYETELFRFKEAFHVKQDRMHNETLDVPVTRGLVSFFAYVLVIFLVFKKGFQVAASSISQSNKLIVVGFLSAITLYLVQNQFSFGVVAITSLFWVMWAVIIKSDTCLEDEEIQKKEKILTIDSVPWLLVALIVLITLASLYISSMPFNADKEFKMGKTYSSARRFREASGFYDKSLAIQPFEGGPITHKGISLINLAAQSKPEERNKIYKEALDILNYGIMVDPYNADNFYIASRIYFINNRIDTALDYANKAIKIDPYYAEVYLILANIAERRGESKKAQLYYIEANRINPNILEAKERVIWQLIDTGKLEKAFQMVQEIIMSNPKHLNAYKALGTIYQKMGKHKEAKEAFDALNR